MYMVSEDYDGETISAISDVFYNYSSPCGVVLLIERSAASCSPRQHETARPWKLFWSAQPICILIAFGITYSKEWHIFMSDNVHDITLFIIQLVIATITLWLLIYNIRQTKLSLGNGTKLTTRYQLSENIRVLKILLPVIFFDVILTLCDLISQIVCNIYMNMNSRVEHTERNFVSTYIAFKIVSCICQLCIPVSVIFFHPIFKKRRNICNVSLVFSQKASSRVEIRSVLGTKINEDHTADKYFSTLRKSWS